mgnify:CR=1 FL=1
MKNNWIILSVVAILGTACAKTEEQAVEEEKSVTETPAAAPATPYVPGVAYVYLSEPMTALVEDALRSEQVPTKAGELGLALQDLNVKSMERLFPDAGEFEPRTRREGLHRWYKISYDTTVPQTRAETSLGTLPGVEIYEPQRRIRSMAVFNDPGLSQQWHYINGKGTDINVEPVWRNYTTGRSKVIVSVVDGGVDLQHEDLAANCLAGGPNGSKNFTTGGYAIDADSHGTHVAGTIAAVNNNGIGVSGIAGGNAAQGIEGVRIMSCQIFGENGGDTPSAIKWGADHGAVLSNNSWGYVVDTNDDGVIDGDELEQAKNMRISASERAAVDYFVKYAGCDNAGNQLPDSPMKGGVVIFAAGNDAIQYGAPADYDGVLAVGATTSEGKRADFSNYGDWVDIAAPGTAIRSTIPGGYGNLQGTSMACPHVTGVAALVVSYAGGPGFTADMLKERLLKGANPDILPINANVGPLVDALGAIIHGSSDTPAVVSSFTAKAVSNSIELTWKVTSNSKGEPATGYVLFASKSSLSNLNPASPGSDVTTAVALTNGKQEGDTMTARVENLDFDTPYYVTLAGYDYGRNFSEVSPQQRVTTLKNNPPEITTAYTGDFRIHAHETVSIPYIVSDPDGHAVKVTCEAGSDAASWSQGSSSDRHVLQIAGNAAEPGSYTASISATDSYGLKASLTIPYTILENQAPVVIGNIGNMLFHQVGEKFTLDMSEFIEDPDGEMLQYSITISDRSVLQLNQQENTLYGTTLSFGVADVTLTGSDARGLKAAQAFKVLVQDPAIEYQAYPNPCKETLYISVPVMAKTATKVRIVASGGKTVFEDALQVSAFEPAAVDMSACAPGRYSLYLSYASKEFTKTVVKL